MWITLGPPPPQSHRVIKGLITLFLFLFTFNSTDTAEVWNTDVRLGVCDWFVYTDRLLLSSHLHPPAMLPKCLVSLSCMNSATRPACQWERERAARCLWVEVIQEVILQCLRVCISTENLHTWSGEGTGSGATKEQQPAPGPCKGDIKDTEYAEEANFSWVQPEQLKVWQGEGGPSLWAGGWRQESSANTQFTGEN